MTQVDWQTAKARAIQAMHDGPLGAGEHEMTEINRVWLNDMLSEGLKVLRESGYLIVRASDPPQHVRSLGFQAHANGGPKAFGTAYEAMVKEMAKETAE